MRSYPTDSDDLKDLEKLNAEQWQVDLLKLNPDYVFWGCFEDYMCDDKGGWSSRVITDDWKNHNWNLDEYNELVNFYFEVYRKNHNCEHCDRSGLNPATKRLSDSWYSFEKEDWRYPNGIGGRRWNNAAWSNHITDLEVEALVKNGRISDLMDKWYRYNEENDTWVFLQEEKEKPRSEWEWVECEKPEMPSAQRVNEWNRTGTGMGHDAINQWICVKTRAEHLGVYGECEHCKGSGVLYDEDKAKVALQLWYLHPRKGCSRGVYIENISQEDIIDIIKYLKKAKDRNNKRFSKL